MSFLDEQATGRINIGGKPTVNTLTRTRRRRKKSQAPMSTETYSLLPQNEFSNIVSKPSDITQVGIGKDLLKQGTAASEVPNVFEKYSITGAAAIGSTINALYPQPEDDEPEDDDIIDELESDPLPEPSHDTGIDDPDSLNNPANQPENKGTGNFLTDLGNAFRGLVELPGNLVNTIFEGGPKPIEPNKNVPITYDPGGKGRDQAAAMEEAISNVVGYTPSPNAGGDDAGGGETGVDGGGADAPTASNVGSLASGGTVKAKNKNSFMSMKGK
mgnify:CR=1 FL=1